MHWYMRFYSVLIVSVLIFCYRDAGGGDGPTLRRTNYVALLGEAGKEIKFHLRSQRHAGYADELSYTLIGADSNEMTSGSVPLGSAQTVSVSPKVNGLCVLELEIGWNVAFLNTGETPSAFIARDGLPLQTIWGIERLYFYVPVRCKRFRVSLLADVRGEGARLLIYSPDGRLVTEEEGDYNSWTAITVDVPAGANGKV